MTGTYVHDGEFLALCLLVTPPRFFSIFNSHFIFMFTWLTSDNVGNVDVPSSSVIYVYLSFMVRMSHAYSCTELPSITL